MAPHATTQAGRPHHNNDHLAFPLRHRDDPHTMAQPLSPTSAPATPVPLRTARLSLALLLGINMFNYIDRYILAAVEPEIRKHFFPETANAAATAAASAKDQMMAAMAKTGSLATAFLVSYMIAAPILSS